MNGTEMNLYANAVAKAEELDRENALKLKQILDLEDLLYDTRICELHDGSPCWCCLPFTGDMAHDATCTRARAATQRLWKKQEAHREEQSY